MILIIHLGHIHLGDMAEVWDIKFSNDGKSMLLITKSNTIYVLDAYNGEKRCGFSVDASPNTTIEATFALDGQICAFRIWRWNIEWLEHPRQKQEMQIQLLPVLTTLKRSFYYKGILSNYFIFVVPLIIHITI
uniref:protein ANTHESIS POMOTING FACTOR 1-like n=1 Tax=Erigeron canadensis TaxID=72917 RepID=UPI001CB907F4|nr:protein ANTHESIS POMOTING FACTOR 1-like [Erigeron canadensis]